MADDPRGTVLVTGAAGFIGFHVAQRMLAQGRAVVGLDNLNAYYDPALKQARLDELAKSNHFHFVRLDLTDRAGMAALFAEHRFGRVLHFAAQAGVRLSLTDPHAYIGDNVSGFLNVLEGCRQHGCGHLVYASSSSVYGTNEKVPFSAHDNADHPISIYAVSKKTNELMAHAYSHLYALPATGLRLFTVYGPWGRPDMAMFSFAASILDGRPIRLFNFGRMKRDFTYIDDVIEAVMRLIDRPTTPNPAWDATRPDPATSAAPFRIYNLGNSQTVEISHVVSLLEAALGRSAVKEMVAMQPGDVAQTSADMTDLERDIGFRAATPIEEGVRRFAAWYLGYRSWGNR